MDTLPTVTPENVESAARALYWVCESEAPCGGRAVYAVSQSLDYAPERGDYGITEDDADPSAFMFWDALAMSDDIDAACAFLLDCINAVRQEF